MVYDHNIWLSMRIVSWIWHWLFKSNAPFGQYVNVDKQLLSVYFFPLLPFVYFCPWMQSYSFLERLQAVVILRKLPQIIYLCLTLTVSSMGCISSFAVNFILAKSGSTFISGTVWLLGIFMAVKLWRNGIIGLTSTWDILISFCKV